MKIQETQAISGQHRKLKKSQQTFENFRNRQKSKWSKDIYLNPRKLMEFIKIERTHGICEMDKESNGIHEKTYKLEVGKEFERKYGNLPEP